MTVLKYADGSACTLTYTALGDKSYPKEKIEVFSDGKVVVMDDFKSVMAYGGKHKGWSSNTMQKGHLEELEALSKALLNGNAWPISLEDQLQASRISFEVEQQIFGSKS